MSCGEHKGLHVCEREARHVHGLLGGEAAGVDFEHFKFSLEVFDGVK